jgi:DNA polymerase-3 subunit chi
VQVDFYQLSSRPIESVLPRIAEKVIESGGRLLVVSGNEALAAQLDASLWTYAAESFLPHGRAGQGGEADQPVLIASSPEPLNGARNIALVDGLWREEATGYERAFLFFDAETVEGARTTWRSLSKREAIEARYWKQDERGRWSQAA